MYYAMNTVTVRNSASARVAWRQQTNSDALYREFYAEHKSGWESLPDDLIEEVNLLAPDVVIKFGMNLLRDPQKFSAPMGVLSFHHGDPSKYRGRPSGFWEIFNRESEIGAVVQQISNILDLGQIVSKGSFKAYKYSYRKTLTLLFLNSAWLLPHALNSLRTDGFKHLNSNLNSPNYRLPSNRQVLIFIGRLIGSYSNHVATGLFREKKWRISRTSIAKVDLLSESVLDVSDGVIEMPKSFGFLADPFISKDGNIYAEVTSKFSNVGRICVLSDARFIDVDLGRLGKARHVSFPTVVEENGKSYLLTEMAAYGYQAICELKSVNSIGECRALVGLNHVGLIDPVLLYWTGCWWLFAGRAGSENEMLFLWSAKTLSDVFVHHPMNPIVVDAARARNAGSILEIDGEIYRLGQNNSGGYGDGVAVMKIIALDANSYQERAINTIKVRGRKGPHGVAFSNDEVIVDSYVEKLSLLAGARRLIGLLKAR